MHLSPGRLKDIVDRNLSVGAVLICHKTTYRQRPEGEVICRGFFDAYGDRVNVVRVMERVAGPEWYEEVDPPE